VPASAPKVTVSLTRFGPQVLRLWSYDQAGNVSKTAGSKEFTVDGPGRPSGRWQLNEGNGTVAADEVTAGRPMTLDGGATWTSGHQPDIDPADHALHFNGTGATASTPQASTPAADVVDTGANFSVSAWVRVSDVSVKRTAVSEGVAATTGFTLGIEPPGADPAANPASFTFTVFNPDPAAPAGKKEAVVRSQVPARVGEWTHLVGVYEPGLHSLMLYVDGQIAAPPTVAGFATVNTPGALRLGRAQTGAAAPGFWAGDIDDVSVYDGGMDSDQVWRIFLLPRVNIVASGARPAK
jgi:hypothetical protein